MELLSLENYTEKFFKESFKELEKNYPGITLDRVKRELEQYSLNTHLNSKETFSGVFVNGAHNRFNNFFKLLKKGIPLEYIRGRAYFYRSEFSVNESVLIPRSETEILVERAVSLSRAVSRDINEPLKIVDVGTGSGAIILSILCELKSSVKAFATDISHEALEVAKQNKFLLRYKYKKSTTLDFIQTDRLLGIDQKFHIVVSNPPYIKEDADRVGVHSQVDSHEPHLALFITDDQYDNWFKEFFKQVESSLYEEGIFLMEGHEDHLQKQKEILAKMDFINVEIIKDYTGRDRFLKGIKKCKN